MSDRENSNLIEIPGGAAFDATLERPIKAMAHSGMTLFARLRTGLAIGRRRGPDLATTTHAGRLLRTLTGIARGELRTLSS
jgi:hypothetical protein